jgi:sugar lactone lactonase YvrE
MKKSICILCFLGLACSLLAANHLPLPPARGAPPVMDQSIDHITQTANNSAVWSLLFADDFELGISNWIMNGDWELQLDNSNQVLHGVAFATAQANMSWDDYRVEVRVRVLSGIAKIAFRVGELHAGYYLGLDADGELSLEEWDGNGWTSLGSDAGPYPAGQWHTLTLEGDGTQLRAYVNGALKIEASDASFTDGFLMLNVSFGEADFDDVWVTGDAPAACPIVPSNGLNAPYGIAFNSQGELFVASATRVSWMTEEGEAVFFALAGAPGDLAIDDNDNLYVVAENDKTIYKITPDGTRTEFVTSLSSPWFVAMGPDGYLYANDSDDIMRIDLGDGSVSLWMADIADAMAFDTAGNLYIQAHETIRKITPDKMVSIVTVLPTIRPYKQYSGIAVDETGNLYVGESLMPQGSETDPPWVPPVVADKVYKITPDGQVSTFASGLGGVWDLVFGSDGYLYVTEHDFNGVSKIAPNGTVIPVVPCNGLATAADMTYGPDSTLYIVSLENFVVARLDAQGQVVAMGTGFNTPSGEARTPALAFNAAGDLFVAEASHYSPQRITRVANGAATVFTHDVVGPSGLAFDATGDLYVSEGPLGNVVRFSPDGIRRSFVSGLNQPQGLAFGPDGLLYAAEIGGNRVSRIDASGTVTPFVTVTGPIDLVCLGDDLLVSAETGDIWQVDPSGTATRFATGPSNAGGITLTPNGSVVVAFGADNSIYGFTAEVTKPGVEVVAPAAGFGVSGQVVSHTFTVRNTGNGRDGFWLAAESEHGWPLEIEGRTFVGPIDCEGARLVQVRVTIPGGAALGATDTLTLTVMSRLSPDVQSSAQAKTVDSHRIYEPLVLKSAD